MKEKDGPGRDVDDDETTTISDAARIDDPFISRLIAAMGLDLEVALANGWNDACTVDLVQQWQNIFGLSKNDILKAAIENAERHGEPPRFPTTLHRALKVHALPGHGDRPRLPKISLAFDAQNFGLEEEDPRFMAISDGLKAHLEPRRPHKNVCSDPDTLQQEADRLLHILLMELPRAGYEPLLKEVWTHIHQNALIGSWPFRKHVVAACHAARKKPAPTQQRNAAPVSDHKSMLALKVREKQPIAMAQLYGVLMAELVVAGEVNAQALEDLRDQAHARRVRRWALKRRLPNAQK